MTTRQRDPDHPVLQQAWRHEVVGFTFDGLAEEPYLDLVLRHSDTKVIRRLRFFSPTEIRISGPSMNWGIAIADVRARQLEGLGVEVYNFEGSEAPIEFSARDVVELPMT